MSKPSEKNAIKKKTNLCKKSEASKKATNQ